MRNFLKSIAIAGGLLAGVLSMSGAQAGTATGTVGVTGTFVASCSLPATTIALGTIDLQSYVQLGKHVRYPTTLAVTCNGPAVPFTLTNTAGNAGSPLTIGTDSTNSACMSQHKTPLASDGYGGTNCAQAGVLAISGVGGTPVAADLVIFNATGGTYVPFTGQGSISATVPVTLAF